MAPNVLAIGASPGQSIDHIGSKNELVRIVNGLSIISCRRQIFFHPHQNFELTLPIPDGNKVELHSMKGDAFMSGVSSGVMKFSKSIVIPGDDI